MTQRQINAASARSEKPVYKHLTPAQKRIVKAMEQIESNDKTIANIESYWVKKLGENWRKSNECNEINLYLKLCYDNITLSEKIARIEEKYALDRIEVMMYHWECVRGYTYSGSY